MNAATLDIARDLCPLILQARDETESARRVAAPIVDRLRATGLCRMALPKEVHGLEVPLGAALDVYETLAYAEASVAWIVWNNALPCFLGRFLAPAARAEIFGESAWLYASSTRPTGRAAVDGDGYRVSGRWSLVSGCELAEWILVTCVVEEGGQPRMHAPGVPEVRLAFVRRGDYEIVDTWHVGGLRGTGSHDVLVKDRRVAHARTVSPGDAITLDRPHGRVPAVCSMAAGFGAQALGLGQRAVDTLEELTRTKISPDSGQALRDRGAVLETITRHATALGAARAWLHARADELWARAAAGEPATLEGISAVWTSALHAADAGRAAVEAAYAAGGTTSLYTDCPLERAHRDMHAMLRHIVVQPFWLEDAGRVRLGASPTHPLYAV